MLDMLTIAPAPCLRSAGSAAWITDTTPKKLVSIKDAQLLFGCLFDRADEAITGIVDERVDPPESFERGGDRRLGVARPRHVERQGEEAIGAILRQILQSRNLPRGRDDIMAMRQSISCEGAAKTGRGAGDEPGFARTGHLLLPSKLQRRVWTPRQNGGGGFIRLYRLVRMDYAI